MGILGAVVFGLLAGLLAKVLMPGHDPGGCIMTSIIGMVGAALGKIISGLVGGPGEVMAWTWSGFAFAVLGAMVLLLIYRMVVARR